MSLARDPDAPAISTRLSVDKWPTVSSIPKLVALLDGAISESSLYQRAREGTLPGCRRVGHRFLIHVLTFIGWLQSGTGDEHPLLQSVPLLPTKNPP